MSLLTQRDREDRPWGYFERFTKSEPSTVKMVVVKPGMRLSLQYHEKRSEYWYVLTGSGTATIGTEEKPAKTGDEFEIGTKIAHRLAAGPQGIVVLEISFGDFDEGDIVRVEDDFGRTSAQSGP